MNHPKPLHTKFPVVFIHGLAGSHNNFKYLQPYFSNTLSFDLPGFGNAPKPKITYDKKIFVDFLAKKITARSILITHSFGGILAKEFAFAYPHLVQHIFLINYPLQRCPHDLKKILIQRWLGRMFIQQDILSKIMCHTKGIWKYAILPFAYVFARKYYESLRDYFRHTYQAETSVIENVLLKDNSLTITFLKDKYSLITGTQDPFVNHKLAHELDTTMVPNMGHLFFGHEEEIAKIIHYKLTLHNG